MPLFDYKCQQCGHISEFFIHNGADTNLKCQSCGSKKLDKMLSVPGIIKNQNREGGSTCCGREERCETPPCSGGGGGCCRG